MLLWAIGAAYGLGTNSPLDDLLCRQLAAASAWCLRAVGWQAGVDPARPSLMLLNGYPCISVGPPCDGLVLYVLLAGFVLAYPGPGRRRLWFIPLGIGALWLLNILRIVVLALNSRYSPGTFDFNHHYAFNAVAYGLLCSLWLLWTRQTARAPVAGESRAQRLARRPLRPGLTARLGAGALLLGGLGLVSLYEHEVVAALKAGWAEALAVGPAWLHRLPGAAAGAAPASVSHLPLPVGAVLLGAYVGASLLCLRLLLPAHAWRLVWRSYAGLLAACLLLVLLGRAGAGDAAYFLSRMLLNFLLSLLPVVGLLVLLWRRPAAGVS